MAQFIYTFELNSVSKEKKLVEETINGETVKVEREVETVVPIVFGFKKPTKAQKDDIDLAYKRHLSNAVRGGVMMLSELQKTIDNRNGVFSDTEIAKKQNLINLFNEKRAKLVDIKEENEEFKAIVNDLDGILKEINAINLKETELYNQSAEGYAKQKTIAEFLSLNSYIISENKDFFAGVKVEDKLESVQEIDENGTENQIKALRIFYFLASSYFNNGVLKKEDYDAALKHILTDKVE